MVTLNGKDHYLGTHGSAESKAAYQRVVGEWLARHETPSAPEGVALCMAEVMLAYLQHAGTYYRASDQQPTREIENIKRALIPLEELYGSSLARDFGPMALKTVRQKMIDVKLSRGVVNQRIGIIKRMIKWASSEELIPTGVYHGLLCVEGLRRGRSPARETEPVRPVPERDVDAILPFLTPTLSAMVILQRLTGMRSGELVSMRGMDISKSGPIWTYRPSHHKTEHHGHSRVVMLGPQSQAILSPLLKDDPSLYIFSPAQSCAERNVERRKIRKTSVQPSQLCRCKKSPKRTPGDQYDRHSYYRAISYAIRRARKAGVEVGDWHPHQLRHNAASRIRRERGLDAARAVLGHRSLAITDTYAEIDGALAESVAAEMS